LEVDRRQEEERREGDLFVGENLLKEGQETATRRAVRDGADLLEEFDAELDIVEGRCRIKGRHERRTVSEGIGVW